MSPHWRRRWAPDILGGVVDAEERPQSREAVVRRILLQRLAQSLASPPDKLLFQTYFRSLGSLGGGLPALVPQVVVFPNEGLLQFGLLREAGVDGIQTSDRADVRRIETALGALPGQEPKCLPLIAARLRSASVRGQA
jgi:hypothetical protein